MLKYSPFTKLYNARYLNDSDNHAIYLMYKLMKIVKCKYIACDVKAAIKLEYILYSLIKHSDEYKNKYSNLYIRFNQLITDDCVQSKSFDQLVEYLLVNNNRNDNNDKINQLSLLTLLADYEQTSNKLDNKLDDQLNNIDDQLTTYINAEISKCRNELITYLYSYSSNQVIYFQDIQFDLIIDDSDSDNNIDDKDNIDNKDNNIVGYSTVINNDRIHCIFDNQRITLSYVLLTIDDNYYEMNCIADIIKGKIHPNHGVRRLLYYIGTPPPKMYKYNSMYSLYVHDYTNNEVAELIKSSIDSRFYQLSEYITYKLYLVYSLLSMTYLSEKIISEDLKEQLEPHYRVILLDYYISRTMVKNLPIIQCMRIIQKSDRNIEYYVPPIITYDDKQILFKESNLLTHYMVENSSIRDLNAALSS